MIVTPTAAGRALLVELRAAHSEVLAECLADWSESDVRALTAALHRFAGDLGRLVEPEATRTR